MIEQDQSEPVEEEYSHEIIADAKIVGVKVITNYEARFIKYKPENISNFVSNKF